MERSNFRYHVEISLPLLLYDRSIHREPMDILLSNEDFVLSSSANDKAPRLFMNGKRAF